MSSENAALYHDVSRDSETGREVQGLFQGFRETEMDVSEQEQLTEELRRSEKDLCDVIDTIPGIVVECSAGRLKCLSEQTTHRVLRHVGFRTIREDGPAYKKSGDDKKVPLRVYFLSRHHPVSQLAVSICY